MVTSGLRDAGYTYFNLDDGWADERDASGRITAIPSRFPHGLGNLSAYIHSRGLQFGLYTDRGTKTCNGNPGSYDYETVDAQQYADWQVDYLKEDNCHAPLGKNNHTEALYRYSLMRDALNATRRPVFFSICGGGDQLPWDDISYYALPPFGTALANAWRVSPDAIGYRTALHALEVNVGLAPYAGAGGYNDPDMLLTSTRGATRRLSEAQSRTQFGIWCVLAAPLLIGGPIAALSAYDLETYTNSELIEVNQDELVRQGIEAAPGVYGRTLHDGSIALVLANAAVTPRTVACDAACWAMLHVANGSRLAVRDLWAHGPPKEAQLANVTVPDTLSVDLGASWESRAFRLTSIIGGEN